MIKISFDLGHPAHFLLFREVILHADEIGFTPIIFFQLKDRLIDLLREENLRGFKRYNKNNMLSRASLLPKDIIQMRNIQKKERIELNIGKGSVIGAWAARSLNKRAITFDDTDRSKIQNSLYTIPASTLYCAKGYELNFGKKQKIIDGIFPLAYLDPKIFHPKKEIPDSMKLLDRGRPIIIRLSDFQAIHDWKYRNNKENIFEKIESLNKDYDILLSVEGNRYPRKLKKYIYDYPASSFHHILAFSKLYIGSGGSTCMEAASLGVPSFYTNPIPPGGVLKYIKKNYELVLFKNSNRDITQDINTILGKGDNFWIEKKQKMLSEFIDVPKYIRNIIHNELNNISSK